MKKIPKALQTLLKENPDLQEMVITEFKDQKGRNLLKSTVSLPPTVVSLIEKIKEIYGLPTQTILHLIPRIFMYMERTYTETEGKDDYNEILRTVRDYYLIDSFNPDDLVKKSYYMGKRDAKNLNSIARASSISRNELISWGIFMIVDKLKQYDEAYEQHVAKYKKEFEGFLRGIQTLKESAIEDLGNKNDEIVLMTGRLERHIQMHLMQFDKYFEDGIWYLGARDSEKADYSKLITDFFGEPDFQDGSKS
jgi:hypothetical protein